MVESIVMVAVVVALGYAVMTFVEYSNSKNIEKKILEETSYLVKHNGGSVTLTQDAFGTKADDYYRVWNKLVAARKVECDGHPAGLHRTQTGLELVIH